MHGEYDYPLQLDHVFTHDSYFGTWRARGRDALKPLLRPAEHQPQLSSYLSIFCLLTYQLNSLTRTRSNLLTVICTLLYSGSSFWLFFYSRLIFVVNINHTVLALRLAPYDISP
ncbi:hypothetical protein PGT21_022946 [Puccinia graminis f. sp. tritici]|uniref:Uncharacterized protein n=1 Tax=Puccinia graminis f. sp. tritici TaxID=56615 RepID=A0A5B0LLX2_PUCGR|nr:hypothetical protein PGT21_022946 [Puccinia graminis f. sp. tritici]